MVGFSLGMKLREKLTGDKGDIYSVVLPHAAKMLLRNQASQCHLSIEWLSEWVKTRNNLRGMS